MVRIEKNELSTKYLELRSEFVLVVVLAESRGERLAARG